MGKILVVDDARFMRVRYRKLLANEGFEVFEAENGQQALKVYEEENPDLVFLDITMPVMDGMDTLKELKSRYDDAQVIMSSALGQERIVISAIKAGAEDFIVKPFKPDKILATAKKHVG